MGNEKHVLSVLQYLKKGIASFLVTLLLIVTLKLMISYKLN